MPGDPPPDLRLTPLRGPGRTVREWLTTFHLVLVAVDPFSRQSTWIVPTAARILLTFQEADCRVAWLVTGGADRCRQFLGKWASEILTFADPEREAVRALGLERLPALVHLGIDGTIAGACEGWDPVCWREVTDRLADVMAWLPPTVPGPADPGPFEGAPALP